MIIKFLASLFLKLLNTTYSFKYYNLENKPKNQKYIYALWHQNILSSMLSHKDHPHWVMASASKDGDIAAYLAKNLGYLPTRGSSSRGGKSAMQEMIKQMKTTGIPAALTLDGPRGPVHEIKTGVIKIAKETNSSIIPITAISEKAIEFRSWDKFRLPLPFSKIHVYLGQALNVTEDLNDLTLEKYKKRLKSEMMQNEKHIRSNLFQIEY